MQRDDPETAAGGQDVVPRGLDGEHFLHLGDLLRHLVGKVVGLRPIFLKVVEFPLVIVGRPLADAGRTPGYPREARAEDGSHPADRGKWRGCP